MFTIPRYSESVPSVTTKKDSPTLPISTPLTAPPISAAIRQVQSTASGAASPQSLKSVESTMPESASSEPTDRSMPPVSTTNVIPIETTKRIELEVSRFSTFACERKSGWLSEK